MGDETHSGTPGCSATRSTCWFQGCRGGRKKLAQLHSRCPPSEAGSADHWEMEELLVAQQGPHCPPQAQLSSPPFSQHLSKHHESKHHQTSSDSATSYQPPRPSPSTHRPCCRVFVRVVDTPPLHIRRIEGSELEGFIDVPDSKAAKA